MKSRQRIYTYLILPALVIGGIVFVNPLGDFPLNDDWQYAYPIKTWLEGNPAFRGVFAPNILLQVVWGALFCLPTGDFDFTWLRISTLVAAVFGAIIFYRICLMGSKSSNVAGFATWALVLNPLYFCLSFSFMTDVPFLTLVTGSLFAFYRYLENRKPGWLAGAVVIAYLGFLIRQPGIILPVVYGLFLALEVRVTRQRLILMGGLLTLTLLVYFAVEEGIKPWLGIADNYVPVGNLYFEALVDKPFYTLVEWVKKGLKTWVYLGIFGLPFLPFLWTRIRVTPLGKLRNLLWILLFNLAVLFFFIGAGKVFPFGGNVWFNLGLGPELLADVYTLGLPNTPSWPEWSMILFNYTGQVSGFLLFVFIWHAFHTLNRSSRRFVLLLIGTILLYLPLLSITSFFDRYLLLPIASFYYILCLFMDPGRLRRWSWKWVPFMLSGLFSLLATKDYLSWNRARAEAFSFLLSEGIGIEEMDAGYEYNGFYNYYEPREEKEGRSFWWVTDDQYLITFGPVDGYHEWVSFPYYRWLFAREDRIRVLVRDE